MLPIDHTSSCISCLTIKYSVPTHSSTCRSNTMEFSVMAHLARVNIVFWVCVCPIPVLPWLIEIIGHVMWKQIWQQAHIQAHIHIVERVERIERNMIHNIFSSTYSYTSYCQYIFFIYSWIIWFVNSKINAVLNFVCQNKPRTNSPTSSTATASRPVQPTSAPSLRLGFLKKN